MKKNKGFTLVEVIVILVILAILAAVLIPSLTTYIDKAREKSVAANARAAYVATQALLSEEYGLNTSFAELSEEKALDTTTIPTRVKVLELAQLDDNAKYANTGNIGDITIKYDAKANITVFKYVETMNSKVYTAEHQASGAWNITSVPKT